VTDHTSCLRLIESVAAAGGLSGGGPVTFSNLSRWRRQTFGDLTAAFAGTAEPAPSSPQFGQAVRLADLAAQQTASTQPQPALPGANQTMPVQVKKLPS
jgi:phospholipase C